MTTAAGQKGVACWHCCMGADTTRPEHLKTQLHGQSASGRTGTPHSNQ